jgi:hypothetical protein
VHRLRRGGDRICPRPRGNYGRSRCTHDESVSDDNHDESVSDDNHDESVSDDNHDESRDHWPALLPHEHVEGGRLNAVVDDKAAPSQLERIISSATAIIAPITLISGLLFYFGYASSRAQYEYFGVDVDTIGLSTQDYVMRSPQPLLVPVLALALVSAALAIVHGGIRRRVAAAVAGARDGKDVDRAAESERMLMWVQRLARGSVAAGLITLVGGVVLLFTYYYLRDWAFYPLVTPVVMAAGSVLVAYGWRMEILSGRHGRSRRAASVSLYLVLSASIFWATATIAEWSGRGLAHSEARHLDRLPSIILDTKEQLFLRSPGIEETVLQSSAGQTFHYRYRGLRLLIQGGERMFLVPKAWSPSNSTLVVPMDDSVRVQFQFQNQVP